MDEDRTANVAQLEQGTEPPAPVAAQPDAEPQVQPQRLLGELSRASQSLAEVLDSLTAEKRELEARVGTLERELERSRAEAATARQETTEQVERARDEGAALLAATAREAARSRARADRAEQLVALVGADRQTATFCLTVGRFQRRRASRDLLAQAVSDGVHVRVSAHHSWRDSLLVAEAEGPSQPLRQYLTWARSRFADDSFREQQT